uniref:Uncharacterized protein n=1 Tax=Marmota marmota marmota TaxID=9994 RepID=A0A8C6AA54_MARMA
MAGSPGALRRLCVLLMAETVSGAWGPSTGTHISPPFPALAVNQTPMADVSIQAGSWGHHHDTGAPAGQ